MIPSAKSLRDPGLNRHHGPLSVKGCNGNRKERCKADAQQGIGVRQPQGGLAHDNPGGYPEHQAYSLFAMAGQAGRQTDHGTELTLPQQGVNSRET